MGGHVGGQERVSAEAIASTLPSMVVIGAAEVLWAAVL